jgi:hypothetical protein
MVIARRGRSLLGCLFGILILVTALYFGVQLVEPHWRYYQFEDTMQQTARFGSQLSDAEILYRLQAKADSLDLPPSAHRLRISRSSRGIAISTDWEEFVVLPGYTKRYVFRARAEGPL